MFPVDGGAVIASPMELSRAQMRDWLRAALETSHETPTGLARKAGLAQSTLTRFLNSDDSPNLSLRSVAKIAHAAGIEPPGIAGAVTPPMSRNSARGGFSAPDAERYEPHAADPFDAAVHAIIGGRQAADAWVLNTRALEGAGFLPGDILIVDLNAQPRAGSIVCAQVYRWAEARAETVFRIYEPPYLVAPSADPALRKPLPVDDDRVVIKGVVIGMLRRP